MLIRKEAISAVLPATTSDDTRYFLSSAQIEPGNNRIIATDGHVLLIATDNAPIADEDFPIIAGAEYHGDPEWPVLVPADTLRAIVSAMPKKTYSPALQTAQLARNGSPTTATLSATDLQAPRVATITKPETHSFPQYERVMPKTEQAVRVSFSVEVLETLIKSARAIAPKKKGTQTITFDIPANDQKRACVLQAAHVTMKGDDVTVTGAAMPCVL